MADQPVDSLGGRTPLEVAYTPNMDYIARKGIGGLIKTIPDSRQPGSDVANLEVLGYDTNLYFTGRAVFEAASMGVSLAPGDVAFRCNLITCEGDKIVDYSAGHITTSEASQLISLLSKELGTERINFYPGISYRHLLVIKEGPVEISTVPPHDIMGQKIDENLPSGEEQELIRGLMFDSVEILSGAEVNRKRRSEGKSEANMIWLWGQGKAIRLPTLQERFGIDGGVISAVDLVRGIGVLAGLAPIDVPGITGYIDTNYRGKADRALDALHQVDLVYLHVEAPDEASHNGDLAAKVQAIENFDRLVVGRVLDGLSTFHEFKVMVLSDHRTPLAIRTHTREAVPVAIFWESQIPDDMSAFTELEAQKGSLRLKSGHELIQRFIERRRG